ncbi:ABC transporter F family member 3-like [Rosa sericea]
MEAGRAELHVVTINHDGGGGSNVKDLHLEGFNVFVGGRDLIMDGAVTLGIMVRLIGRNATGKTTFLRHLAMHAIDSIRQVLHVEQEVAGDDTSALQCVVKTDIERTQLLEEEDRLLAQQRELELEKEVGKSNGEIDKDAIGLRLQMPMEKFLIDVFFLLVLVFVCIFVKSEEYSYDFSK